MKKLKSEKEKLLKKIREIIFIHETEILFSISIRDWKKKIDEERFLRSKRNTWAQLENLFFNS